MSVVKLSFAGAVSVGVGLQDVSRARATKPIDRKKERGDMGSV
jgi:hypothetical protein